MAQRDLTWLQNTVEPLLNQPFQFYGTQLELGAHDRVNLMQNELFMAYQGKIRSLQEQRRIENSGTTFAEHEMRKYQQQNDFLKA